MCACDQRSTRVVGGGGGGAYQIFDSEDVAQFTVCDDSGKVLGRCVLSVDYSDPKGAKAAEWLRLVPEALAAGEESMTSREATTVTPELFVKYKFAPRKRKATFCASPMPSQRMSSGMKAEMGR